MSEPDLVLGGLGTDEGLHAARVEAQGATRQVDMLEGGHCTLQGGRRSTVMTDHSNTTNRHRQ